MIRGMNINAKDVIKEIMNTVTDELVICSTGMMSRLVYHERDRPENFYVMGSMGASLGIGIGLALHKPERKVLVIAGDGDILMSLGTVVLMNSLQLPNLKLIIIDNNCYSSTGCQPTCSDAVDFTTLAACQVYNVPAEKEDVGRVALSPKEITKRFMNAIR